MFCHDQEFLPVTEVSCRETRSLKSICLKRITALLNKRYWSRFIKSNENQNPFSLLPHNLVEQLLQAVITTHETLSLPYIYPLLTSRRITKFILKYRISPKWKQFIDILNTLSEHALQLKVLILKNSIKNAGGFPDARNKIESAINRLLLASPNLEIIQSSLPFDLKCIQKLLKLKELELESTFEGSVYDMVPKIADIYTKNDTITNFSCSFEKEGLDELVFILQHWIGLTCVKDNIAYALEHCHGHELVNRTLTKRYKLQDIKLAPDSQCVTSTINIASITCPDVRHLNLILRREGTLAALCNFKKLEVLRINYPTRCINERDVEGISDFQFDLKLAVETIGAKLKRLEMTGIRNIDLSIIGRFCRNLSHLEISNGSILASGEVPSFEHLEHLSLSFCNRDDRSNEMLLQFLPQCKIVSSIQFRIPCLDDNILKELLSRNVWPELKSASFDSYTISKTMGQALHQYSPSSTITIYDSRGCCR